MREKVAILGTGKMGSAVGKRLANAGLHVIYGSRTPQSNAKRFADLQNVTVMDYGEACSESKCIIVAVPWAITLDLLQEYDDCLKGKTIIDLTNPTSADWSRMVVQVDSSAAEEIAKVSSASYVVKAFNGITADNFTRPDFSGEPAQILYCGDDAEAKLAVNELICICGFKPIDCGSLANARYLESIAMLWVQLAFWEDWGSEFSFKLIGNVPMKNCEYTEQTH